MTNIDDTVKDFLGALSGKIKNAGGFVEVYYAFSTLGDARWVEYCHQNMLDIYLEAKDLLEQLKHDAPAEELWPLLDDLSFHSAVFECYYFILESVLSEMLLEEGDYSTNVPARIADASPVGNLEHILITAIEAFQQLLGAYEVSDVSEQRRYMSNLYLAATQIQYIAARSRADM